jgi:hypothetical protein
MYDWLSLGMLGIVSLLFVLGVHFAKAIRRGHTIYLYLLVILSISFFTESVLSLQQGVLFYSIFTSLLFFLPREEKVAEPGQL